MISTVRAMLALVAFALFVARVALPAPVAAHGELEASRSDPAPGAVFGNAPTRLDLWFSEPLLPDRSGIEVYDAERRRVDDGAAHVDRADARHLFVTLQPLLDGTYTVAWCSASEADGHTLRGTFSFRVGQARLPGGAATTAGEEPRPSGVALRWLTILGLSLVSGWLLLALLGAPVGEPRPRPWPWLAAGGALLALLADLAAIPVQARWPATGLPRQPVADILSVLPPSWYARVALEGLLVPLVLVGYRRRSWFVPGAGIAALAILLLTFTSHAAAQERNRTLLMAINAAHLVAVAFWLGGVLQWGLNPALRRALGGEALRRFSRLALALALTALATGAASAGFLLPSLQSLWASDYGRVLLVKTAIVLVTLALAWRNRRYLAAGLAQVGRMLRTLRGEAATGMAALLAATVLALSAPPLPADARPLDLRVSVAEDHFAHLVLRRPDVGRREVTAWLADSNDQPVTDLRAALLTISHLERPIDHPTRRLEPQPGGIWKATNVELTVKGWWQASLTFVRAGGEAQQARVVFLLPDPTHFDPERSRATEADAEQLFTNALDQLLAVRSLRTHDVLSDGVGKSASTHYAWAAPNKLAYSTASGYHSVAIEREQFYQRPDGTWEQRERVDPVRFPEVIGTYYRGATGFTLGRTTEIDGRSYQFISFFVPFDGVHDESWYGWWIDRETARVTFESMAARYHYMYNTFVDYNPPVEIARPGNVTPEAGLETPGDTP